MSVSKNTPSEDQQIVSMLKRIGIGIADRFFLLRPLVVVPAITFFLLGYYDASFDYSPRAGKLVLAILSYAILMGSVYIVNEVTDVESDRKNEKLFLLSEGIIKKNEALVLSLILALVSLVAAFGLGGAAPWLFILSLAMGIAYSVPPLALKRLFPFDIAMNGLGYGVVAYAAGWSVFDVPGLSDLAAALPFALCVAAVFVLTALADREGDRASGFKSTGVVLSPEQAVWLALGMIVVAFVLSLLLGNRIAMLGSMLSLPFFVYSAVRVGPQSVKIAYRCSSAVFVLIVGILHPVFLVVVLVLLGLSRAYYSKRFSLAYPSIRGR